MKINAHVVAQAPDGSIWAAFAMDNEDTTLVMTKAEALDLAKQLTAAAESSPQTTKLVCGWRKGSGKDYSELVRRQWCQ